MIDTDKVLVIGNKPYRNFSLSPVLDKFEHNIRCNFVVAGNNNGTILDQLALCNHLYHNFVGHPASLEKIIKVYGDAYDLDYINNTYETFCKNIKKYKNVFHANYGPRQNQILKKLNCPYKISKISRTGLTVVLDLVAQGKEAFVTNFSIINEIRHSYCLKEGFAEKAYAKGGTKHHNTQEEVEVLRWLHLKGIVDASLCLLEDKTDLCFITEELQPTKVITDLLMKVDGKKQHED